MSGGWTARRFWNAATAEPVSDGYAVLLDGRPVKTPAKARLVVPTDALAQAIAAEWNAQSESVDPSTMPFTRMANSAIDKLSEQGSEVVAMLAEYGGTDLLCYRAEGPQALVERQDATWDPILDWAAATFGARLRSGRGILPVPQDPVALERLRAPVAALCRFRLAAFHDLVAISGSLVIALAVLRGHLSPEEAWDASRVDETWQNQLWGVDDEAATAEAIRRADFLQADRFLRLCR